MPRRGESERDLSVAPTGGANISSRVDRKTFKFVDTPKPQWRSKPPRLLRHCNHPERSSLGDPLPISSMYGG